VSGFLRTLKNIFFLEDLRKKLSFTVLVLAVFRLGKHVPLPGINTEVLANLGGSYFSGGFLHYFNLMSGGALQSGAIFSLGVMPYITASIMMQMLTVAVPSLEALAKEGGSGRRIINQYTRYLALLLSVGQGFATISILESGLGQGAPIVLFPGWGFRFTSILILSVGAMFVMWMGEQITQSGLGQGASVLIFANIVAGMPAGLVKIANSLHIGQLDILFGLAIMLFALVLTGAIVFIERGERRIPVQYARRVVGNRVFGGVNTYIPLKLNSAGGPSKVTINLCITKNLTVSFLHFYKSTFTLVFYFLKSPHSAVRAEQHQFELPYP